MTAQKDQTVAVAQAPIPQVAILMATYNGGLYLQEQLDSFANQTENNWVLWVSDDGSSDATKSILKKFADRFPLGKVNIVDGPRVGFARNFLSLIHNPLVEAQNYAYSDQDDVWFDDKLERAITQLEKFPTEEPALYCSRTEYVDENLIHIGFSDDYQRPATFCNALVQNIASGNTMVFNQASRNLLVSPGKAIDIPLHDWWTYMAVMACGGKTFFDRRPTVRYRQHGDNLWGMNTGWANRGIRIKKLFEGRFKGWNERHVVALKNFYNKITPANQAIYENFVRARVTRFPNRIYYLKKSRVYRQTTLGNLGLVLAAITAKL